MLCVGLILICTPFCLQWQKNMALNYMREHFAISSASLKTCTSLAQCCCQLWDDGFRLFVSVQLFVSVYQLTPVVDPNIGFISVSPYKNIQKDHILISEVCLRGTLQAGKLSFIHCSLYSSSVLWGRRTNLSYIA